MNAELDDTSFGKPSDYLTRAKSVIPGGLFGHFKFPALMSEGSFPTFASCGKGAYLWDITGKKYIDYINGLGANLLGYSFDPVEDFVRENVTRGDCLSLMRPCYVELAEEIVQTVASADWAVFATNGADVTSMSIVASRAHTERNKLVGIKYGYHGPHLNWGWCTPGRGRFIEDYGNTILCEWNNLENLEDIFKSAGREIAACILTPVLQPVFADSIMPDPAFLELARSLCSKYGSILIFDDVRTGMRLDSRGSDAFFGVQADLICMSKAIGNTYGISSLLGSKALYNTMTEIFFSGTFWGAQESLLAARATLRFCRENSVVDHLNKLGGLLATGLDKIAKSRNIPIKISGPAGMPYLRFLDDNAGECERALTFAKHASERGVLFHPFHNWCLTYSHTESDVYETLKIAEESFDEIQKDYYQF